MVLLRQLIAVARTLSDAVYGAAGPASLQGSVGAHVRHIHDHYLLLLDGLADRRIDYENRPREVRIEQDRAYALDILEGLIPALAGIPASLADTVVDIQSACGLNDAKRWCRSTVKRELECLVMHDVHHHALIAFLLQHHDVSTPAGFGVAPSTRRHLQDRPSCVR